MVIFDERLDQIGGVYRGLSGGFHGDELTQNVVVCFIYFVLRTKYLCHKGKHSFY